MPAAPRQAMQDLPLDLQERLKACRTLPSVPSVVLEVLDLCQNEECGIPDVSRVLERDPALCAKVLKVANSAWYGVRSQVNTLDRALALLGINATLSLALSFSLVRGLARSHAGKFDHEAYWRRSAIVAAVAKVVGGPRGSGTRDELFLAGLLQDIGMLALNEAITDVYGPIVAEAAGDHRKLVEIERRELGADHAAVGTWLLGRWNLPDSLRQAVAGSHDPAVVSADCGPLVRAIAAANSIAEVWANPQTEAATETARTAAVSLLGLREEGFSHLLEKIAAELPHATSNLDIDIGGEAEVARILDQAREALVVLSLHAQQQVREFRRRSQYDQLTSLYNRAYLDELLPEYFATAKRMSQSLSIVFLDLDHFKAINDTFGHAAGDQVLISVARILRATLRGPDIVGRYGGEEFLCLLPNTGDEGAAIVGERLRAAVAEGDHAADPTLEIPVTISAGCATMSSRRQFAAPVEMVNAADKCLYAAKSGGRNRVVTLDTLTAPESVA